jgi:hypothetical protein
MSEEEVWRLWIGSDLGDTTQRTSELCFIAGKLHQRVWNMTTGAVAWEPVQSFETIEEANAA